VVKRLRSLLLAVGVLGALAGCDRVLGLERRTLDPAGTGGQGGAGQGGAGQGGDPSGCKTALECEQGRFCNAGACTALPPIPTGVDCQVLEPSEKPTVAEFDWTTKHHVLGSLFRLKNPGELPRLQAMRLAVRQINDAGGIREVMGPSTKVAMVACDYGGSDGQAAGAAADPAIRAGLDYLGPALGARVVVAGSSTSATNTAIQHLMTNEIPVALLSSFSTSPTLNDFSDRLSGSTAGLLWRTAPDDTIQARALARIVDSTPNATRLGVLYVNDDYGTALQEAVTAELAMLSKKLPVKLSTFSATPTLAELEGKLSELMSGASKPDVLLVVGADGIAAALAFTAVVSTENDSAFKAYVLADAAKEKDALLAAGLSAKVRAIVAKARGTAPYHSPAPHYLTFETQLMTAFGVAAEDYSFIANSFDAVYLAGYAISWAHASGELFEGRDVAAGLASLSSGKDVKIGSSSWNTATKDLTDLALMPRSIDVDGTSGRLDFDSNGQATGPIEIWRVAANGTSFETCAVCFATADECEPATCAPP
jgi:branched-chain amino acid transport system substrate-binding protein